MGFHFCFISSSVVCVCHFSCEMKVSIEEASDEIHSKKGGVFLKKKEIHRDVR